MKKRHPLDSLGDDIRDHIDREAQQNVDAGMSPAEARHAALRKFGNVTLTKENTRAVWVPAWIDQVMQDVRYGIRTLGKAPGFSTVAILTLALGIGANTAIFSIVNSLVLRTLPVTAPERLASLSSGSGQGAQRWTYAIWDQVRQRLQDFDGVLAWSSQRFNLALEGEMEPVDGLFVSGEYFSTLGVSALLGRTFTVADDVRGGGSAGAVAVISYGFWQRQFGGAADAVGKRLTVERVPFTIIGVMPPGFFGAEVGRAFDIAVPIGDEPLIYGKGTALDRPGNYWLNVMVRLGPGQSIKTAAATLRGMQAHIRDAAMPQNFPVRAQAEFLKEPFELVQAASGISALRQQYQRPLMTIFVVVALVLLIACANIANLQLARATTRHHELSVRLALGAPRWRLARQLLVESLVLSIGGAVAGLLFAAWGSRALVAELSTQVSRVVIDLPLDWRVLAFTAGLTVGTTTLFGMAPALRASRVAPIDALKDHGRGASGQTRARLSNGLVVAQVALSLALVVAAGLFVRTFARLTNLPLGFDSDRVLVVNVNATRAQVDQAARLPFFSRLIGAIAAVPGVAHAAGSMITPVSGAGLLDVVEVPGGSTMPERERSVAFNYVTPGWLATYGTALRAGRDIEDGDTKTALPVTLVNEAFVRRFYPGQSAIGGTVAFSVRRPGEVVAPKRIVGVVADAVYRSLRDEMRPTMYVPLAQIESQITLSGISIGVRSTAGSPVSLARSVARTLMDIDPGLSFNFRPLQDQVSGTLIQEWLVAMLSGFFGALALLLAAVGLYGVTSYTVGLRRTEIAIRMALGATRGAVMRLVLGRVWMLVGTGICLGLALSVWASRFVATLLYGLEPRDPATLVSAAIVLTTVGAVAGWLPAHRASRLEPTKILSDI